MLSNIAVLLAKARDRTFQFNELDRLYIGLYHHVATVLTSSPLP
jgi:hypothetical protein